MDELIRNVLIGISMCIFPFGCQLGQGFEYKSDIRISLQNRVANIAKKKHNVYASGFGFWGPDNYKIIKISFDYYDLLNEDDGRYMVVDIAANFLEETNNDGKIRPFLIQYPYQIENVTISIFPNKAGNESPVHPDYMLIKLHKGEISYNTMKEGQIYDYHSEKTETFEEALEKLREQGRVPEYFKNYPQI